MQDPDLSTDSASQISQPDIYSCVDEALLRFNFINDSSIVLSFSVLKHKSLKILRLFLIVLEINFQYGSPYTI